MLYTKFLRFKRMQSSESKLGQGATIVIATYNKGKIAEFKSLLSKFKLKILTSSDLKIADASETGRTFEENAILKVKSIPSNYISLSDDSGLCVKCLDNKPGILSARFAKNCGGWIHAMKKIYNEILEVGGENFSARFLCSLALRFPNDKIFLYNGEISGSLTWPPRGNNGFGYDPFFIPDGYNITFGEMEHKKKILIDHRSIALKELIKLHLSDK